MQLHILATRLLGLSVIDTRLTRTGSIRTFFDEWGVTYVAPRSSKGTWILFFCRIEYGLGDLFLG